MKGQFTVSLTARDMGMANRLMLRHHPVRRYAPAVILLIAIGMGVLLALSARHFHPEHTQRALLAIFAKGLAATLLFLGLQYLWLFATMLRAAREVEAEDVEIRREVTYRFDTAGLTACEDSGTATWPWRAFARPVEDADWLLLRRSIATFCAIPKSQLDADTLLALKQMLQIPRASAKP